MKNPTRFGGILLLILGVILCVVNAIVPGAILFLIGIFMSAGGHSKEKKAQKNARVPTPIAPPVVVPGAPAADAYDYNGSVENYFADLLRGCFPT